MAEEIIARKIKELFIYRDDAYAEQYKGKDGKKAFRTINSQLTTERIVSHLKGDIYALGAYEIGRENKVRYGGYDFDLNTEEDYQKAVKLFQFVKAEGFHPILENSGGGKFKIHIWLCFKDYPLAKDVKALMHHLTNKAGITPHEVFPKQFQISPDGYGNFLKLPLGKNAESGDFSFFYDENLNPITNNDEIIRKLDYHLSNLDEVKDISAPAATLPEQAKQIELVVEKGDIQNVKTDVTITNKPEIKPHKYDNFFNVCLHTEFTPGSKLDNSKFKGITGIAVNLLKNEAIWFFEKGYNELLLDTEIKPIFDKNNWSYSSLKSWFKQVGEAKYRKINRGELVNWSKLTAPEMLKHLPYEPMYLTEEKAEMFTSHCPEIQLLKPVLKLHSHDEEIIRRAIHRILVSQAIPKNLLSVNVGEIETDVRFNAIFIRPSGKGKSNIKLCIRDVLQAYKPDVKIRELAAFNKHQLIGKVVKREDEVDSGLKDNNGVPIKNKKTRYVKKLGFVFSDVMILEEGYELLTSTHKEDIDCRDVLTRAYDIYGRNIMEKENIDDLPEENDLIFGYPEGICIAFLQPLPLPDFIVEKGLFRRFFTFYDRQLKRSSSKVFLNKLLASGNCQNEINRFTDYLKSITDALKDKNKWEIDEATLYIVQECHQALLNQWSLRGGKFKNYINMVEHHYQNSLLKLAAISAASRKTNRIESYDVYGAFIDLLENAVYEGKFLEEKVKGRFDYSGVSVDKNREELVSWFIQNGATSYEKSILALEAVKNRISEIWRIQKRQSDEKFKALEEEGLFTVKRGDNKKVKSRAWVEVKQDTNDSYYEEWDEELIVPIDVYEKAKIEAAKLQIADALDKKEI